LNIRASIRGSGLYSISFRFFGGDSDKLTTGWGFDCF
jgi:hypothetical protein